MFSLNSFYVTFLFFIVSRGAILNWSWLPITSKNESSISFRDVAENRIQSLRNLRNKLSTNVESPSRLSNDSDNRNGLVLKLKEKEEISGGMGGLLKNLETFLYFTGPLQKLMSTKQGIESLAKMVIPKKDVLKRLLDIKGSLEPTLKRYLTDRFNEFLTSLVPYSENMGVPAFVLNSMKISEDSDPRWQLIKSLLNSNHGVEKFLHSLVNGKSIKLSTKGIIESRSGDETDLISDQEPDATGQAYRRQQQLYLNSFKKRLMMPAAGSRVRLVPGTRPAVDYESMLDQNGQYGHVTYEVSAPEGVDGETYYGGNGNDDMDMTMSASGGRGHGHHGHSQSHASYGGFLDPFTILGGLAFLTYLGLMLQNSLNRNGTGTMGRSLPWDSRLRVVPINLLPILNKNSKFIGTDSLQRSERSLATKSPKAPLTVDQVVQDLNGMWRQINDFKKQSMDNDSPICKRYKLCMLAFKLKDMNLEFLLDLSKLAGTIDKSARSEVFPGIGFQTLCHFDSLKECIN